MKRAILIGMGTIAGTAAVLGYHPGTLFGTSATEASAATAAVTSTTSTVAGGTTTTSTAATTETFTGDAFSTQWGDVQVEATVSDGTLVSVTTLSYPDNDGHSANLNATAVPTLEQQAVEAQSASIDGVSGASYTSAAFAQSLQSALTQAGLA